MVQKDYTPYLIGGGIIAAAYLIYKSNILQNAGTIVSGVSEGATEAAKSTGMAFSDVEELIKTVSQSYGGALKSVADQAKGTVNLVGNDLIKPAVTNTGTTVQNVTGTASDITSYLRQAVNYEASAIKGLFYTIPNTIGQNVAAANQAVATAITNTSKDVVGKAKLVTQLPSIPTIIGSIGKAITTKNTTAAKNTTPAKTKTVTSEQAKNDLYKKLGLI